MADQRRPLLGVSGPRVGVFAPFVTPVLLALAAVCVIILSLTARQVGEGSSKLVLLERWRPLTADDAKRVERDGKRGVRKSELFRFFGLNHFPGHGLLSTKPKSLKEVGGAAGLMGRFGNGGRESELRQLARLDELYLARVEREKARGVKGRQQMMFEVQGADNGKTYRLPWWCIIVHNEAQGQGQGWDGARAPQGASGPLGVDCTAPHYKAPPPGAAAARGADTGEGESSAASESSATTEAASSTGTTSEAAGSNAGTATEAASTTEASTTGTTTTTEAASSTGTTTTAEAASSTGTTATTEAASSTGTTTTTEAASSTGTTTTAEAASSTGTTATTEAASSSETTVTATATR